MLETLVRCELIKIRILGLPLQGSLTERRYYHITRKGLEFIDTYKKIQGLITILEAEPRRQPSGLPMDILD